MIKISTSNERETGFDLEVEIKGSGGYVAEELTVILDHCYKYFPELFEFALLHSKYTEDHT